MFTFVQRPAVLLVALTALLSPAAGIPQVIHQTDKEMITVKNTTKFNMDKIFISPEEEKHWRDDILSDSEIPKPGESIEVELDCGKWDVKLIADDESECEVEDVTPCGTNQWNVIADC